MLVYMTHPNHGTHIAYSDDEVEKCKTHGWVVHGPRPPGEKPMVVPAKDFHDSFPVKATEPVVGVDYDGDGKIDRVFRRRKKA